MAPQGKLWYNMRWIAGGRKESAMRIRNATRRWLILFATAAVLSGFGDLDAGRRGDQEAESRSNLDAAIELADVQQGEVFIPDERLPSQLIINVANSGDVSISGTVMTKEKLFS